VKWIRAFVCAFSLWPSASLAQSTESRNEWFLRTGVTAARIFSDNPFILKSEASTIRWGPSLTVEVGRQTDGSQEWHHLYGIPSWGLGVSLASFSDGAHRTRPIDAYTFFSWPFVRLNDRLDLTTDFGMGVSWRWKEFDGETGSEATVLGSDVNARIDWGVYLRYATTSRTRLYMGADFTHRSNGGMVQPDLGIDTIGPRVFLQYNLAPGTSHRQPKEPPPFTPSWDFVVGGAASVKNVAERRTPIYRQDFGSTVITAAAQWQFYRYGKFAFGTDATYDGSTGARLDEADTLWRPDAGQRWSLGTYGGYEHVIGRFGAIAQLGYYAARGFDNPTKPRFYQRLGWRYRVTDRLWSTIAIRTIGDGRADALEVGAGYRMKFPWSH
jgi:hypothetical protein